MRKSRDVVFGEVRGWLGEHDDPEVSVELLVRRLASDSRKLRAIQGILAAVLDVSLRITPYANAKGSTIDDRK